MDIPLGVACAHQMPPGFPSICEETEDLVFNDLRPLFNKPTSFHLSCSHVVNDDLIDDVTAVLSVSQVSDTSGHVGSRPTLSRSHTLPAIVVADVSQSLHGSPTDSNPASPVLAAASPRANPDRDSCRRQTLSTTASPVSAGRNGGARASLSPGYCRLTASESPRPSIGSAAGAFSRLLSPDRNTWTHLNNESGSDQRTPSPLRRSSSIDRLPTSPCTPLSRSPEGTPPLCKPGQLQLLAPPTSASKLLDLSPSIRRRICKEKDLWRQGSMEMLVDGLNMSKSERKRLEKINKINIHLHALYAAVEHGQLDKARAILKTTDVNVNSLNGDGFSLLDVSLMTSNLPMARLLLSCAAKESTLFLSADSRCCHLQELVRKAQRRVDALSRYSDASCGSYSAKEGQRQHDLWRRRLALLNKMKAAFDQARPPDPPSRVTVEVTGTDEVRVRLEEPLNQHLSICTKYKVQWSRCADFAAVEGECDVTELVPPPQLPVRQLRRTHRYYIRAAAGNFYGWSRFVAASPASAVPSGWRDDAVPGVEQRVSRFSEKVAVLDRLFAKIRSARPEHASDLRALDTGVVSPQARRSAKKKGIKQLFQTSARFHKNLKHGVYLASILYFEDRVAMTTEDFLPILEVDESYPSSIHADFHWLMKVACTWDDVRSLRQDMERSLSSSAVHFRIKLLSAAEQMQTSLGVQNLGQLYFNPLRDSSGALVLVTINHIRCAKLPSTTVRWQPMNRLQRKQSTVGLDESSCCTVAEKLVAELKQVVTYHMVSSSAVPRGLYLGFLQCQTSVEQMRVSVARDKPNMLPHVRVRDNPHVCQEEWAWLREGCARSSPPYLERDQEGMGPPPVTFSSRFQGQIELAVRRLFKLIDVSPDQAASHRLYNGEVLELSRTASLILLVPPSDLVCSVTQCDLPTDLPVHSCLHLPVQTFEMVHLMAYQRNFVSRYSRISSILETDTIMAQHAHREAFNDAEIVEARGRLAQLHSFQTELESVWRGSRWLTDAIAWARERNQVGCAVPAAALRGWSSADITVSPVHDAKRLRKDVGPCTLFPPEPPHHAEFKRSSSQRLLKSRPEFQKSRTSECLLKGRSGSVGLVLSAGEEDGQQLQPLVTGARDQHQESSSDESICRAVVRPSSGRSNLLSVQPDMRKCSAPEVLVHAAAVAAAVDTDHHRDEDVAPSAATYSEQRWLSVSTPSFGVPARRGDTDSVTSSARSLSSTSTTETDTQSAVDDDEPGILQVFAAYETGLASGTSVRLHVTQRTSSREVVDLVVKQLNMAVVLKGRLGPVYEARLLPSFCLVAVIGARERCLRDDFRPLRLQNPWRRGKLFVRRRSEVLAALQQAATTDI